jgi:hypothetical protein
MNERYRPMSNEAIVLKVKKIFNSLMIKFDLYFNLEKYHYEKKMFLKFFV